jgi:NAD(P)-dependent dehydrogenase (short-subunit alcohol dehydrogenase family)
MSIDFKGRVAIVTGAGAGLGRIHAIELAKRGAKVVVNDLGSSVDGSGGSSAAAQAVVEEIKKAGGEAIANGASVSDKKGAESIVQDAVKAFGTVDILINNAARNPKVEPTDGPEWSRLESFPVDLWDADLAVGLTGAFLCSQVLGTEMARRGKGVIVNIASDLAIIGPDQRLYRQEGLPEEQQPVKPVTYSVVKAGLVGLTRYLATYWADRGVRVNAISPGGVFAGQPEEFLSRLHALIPLGRMANVDEYQGAILFLCSDASSYMTGTNLVVDGGRTTW